ncbi:two-component sensor histidine kinase [Marinobacter vulgaris]|uniref:histidine kinase n=1 Tax=Marinobacter vulgaris TaxID=1928331 RepID=A0A2V3ZRJ0_9GAMM|nr:ATP-binding protein [Marinobacter vulgaris]PXX92500.1 two-component sensor histidine kinase [Marinobacter vulgaris]TSJ71555.1 HAMP domain-containing histidine kinase [Marinobacter vulgaris]
MRNFEDDPTLEDLLTSDQRQRLNQMLSALCRKPVSIGKDRSNGSVALEFNLETVGWLSGGSCEQERLAVADLVSFLMMFIAKYRLAANLHHDTTEASYAELQKQNAALKASEARYRALSDQLQEKVDEQVAVIKQAQMDLYESARLRSVGQLAAGVAHEINNPIGFMSSNLKVAGDYVNDLRERVPDSELNRDLLDDFADLIAESSDGARRIASIVSDLKTFSSIDQADHTLCDVNDLLSSAVHLLQTEYGHGVDILEKPGELPKISGHPSRLSQTFYNLLDNAVQALKCRQQGAGAEGWSGRILAKTSVDDGGIRVVIQDNGCGIAEDIREQVFDAFFTSRPVGSGTGLGLTVARDTARAHQGTIQIDSREDMGCRVTLFLPIR